MDGVSKWNSSIVDNFWNNIFGKMGIRHYSIDIIVDAKIWEIENEGRSVILDESFLFVRYFSIF